MLGKFCVFCGAEHTIKTKEHIIPRWLIELTGDPNRKVYLGRQWLDPGLSERSYSLSAFTFPACGMCNKRYAALEADVKTIIESMLSCSPLCASDLDRLLDWLDKVRTGIWLGMIYLNKNYRGVVPQFHITSRTAAQDRMLVLYRATDSKEGLGLGGVDTPIFHKMPSCFTLTINHLHILNISSGFLFSRQIGFPYPSQRMFHEDRDEIEISLSGGTGVVAFPLIPWTIKDGGTAIYQPIIPRTMIHAEEDLFGEYYDNGYVRDHCRDFGAGRGKLYQRSGEELREYPSTPSSDWLPQRAFSTHELVSELGIQSGMIQDQLFADIPSMENLSPERRESLQAEIDGVRRLHAVIMEHFRKQTRMFQFAFR